MTDKQKIAEEEKRLSDLYSEIEPKKQIAAKGLISRAAFMKVKLEVLEEDLDKNGFVEMFRQGAQEPYERQRPNATLYSTWNSTYQKIIKQLTDLLPKEDPKAKQEQGDGFEDFVIGRDDS